VSTELISDLAKVICSRHPCSAGVLAWQKRFAKDLLSLKATQQQQIAALELSSTPTQPP